MLLVVVDRVVCDHSARLCGIVSATLADDDT
jgi:hypothetical protein